MKEEYDALVADGAQVLLEKKFVSSPYGDPLELVEAPPARKPTFGESLAAFLTREQASQWVVWGVPRQSSERPRPVDDEFIVQQHPLWKTIPENERPLYDNVASEEALKEMMDQVGRAKSARAITAATSFGQNLGAGLVASLADPVTFIEMAVGGMVGGAAKLHKLSKISRIAAGTGAAALTSASMGTVREFGFLGDQPLRTDEERINNILWETAFGTVLGGAASGLAVIAGRQAAVAGAAATTTGVQGVAAKAEALTGQKLVSKGINEPTEVQYREAMAEVLMEPGNGFHLDYGKVWDPVTKKTRILSNTVGRLGTQFMRLLTPFHKLATSEFEAARMVTQIYSDIPVARTGVDPRLQRVSLDAEKAQLSGEILGSVTHMNQVRRGMSGADALPRDEFMDLVGIAASWGDQIDARRAGRPLSPAQITSVNAAARILRSQMERIHAMGVETGAWASKPDLQGTALTHFTRVWNHQLAKLEEPKLRALVKAWADHQKKTGQGDWTAEDINATVEAIQGGRPKLGNVPGTEASFRSAAKAARQFDIPNDFSTTLNGQVIRTSDFLINNAERILEHNTHFVLPNLILAKRLQTRAGATIANRGSHVHELVDDLTGPTLSSFDRRSPVVANAWTKLDAEAVRQFADETADLWEVAGNKAWFDTHAETYFGLADKLIEIRKDLIKARVRAGRLRQVVATMESKASLPPAHQKMLADFKDELVQKEVEIKSLEASHSTTRDIMRPLEDGANYGATGEKLDRKLVSPADADKDWWADDQKFLERAEELADTVVVKAHDALDRAVVGLRLTNAMKNELKAKAATRPNDVKYRAKLEKKMNSALSSMELAALRFRNISHIRGGAGEFAGGLESWMFELNHATKMGGVLISSSADVANNVMWLGMRDWFSGAVVHFRQEILRFVKGAKRDDVAMFIHGMEVVSGAGRNEMMSGLDLSHLYANNSRSSRARRGLRKFTSKAFMISWWNEQAKRLASTQIQHKMIRLLNKEKLSARDIEFFTRFGANEGTINAWRKELTKFGSKMPVEGAKTQYELAGVGKWKNRDAAQRWKSFITSISNNSVVSRGSLDLGKMFDMPWARLLVQFKSFAVATFSRMTLAGMGTGDMQWLMGALSLAVMGHLIHETKTWLLGHSTKDEDLKTKLYNAVDRSGLPGVVGEFDAASSMLFDTGFHAWAGGKHSRSSARGSVQTIAGPSVGTIEDMWRAGQAAFGDGPPTMSQLGGARDLVPFQNTFYLSWLLDRVVAPALTHGRRTKIEEAFGEAIGAKERK